MKDRELTAEDRTKIAEAMIRTRKRIFKFQERINEIIREDIREGADEEYDKK